MMQFRQHKGLLADSMATVVRLDPTREALCRHLMSLPGFAPSPHDLRVEPYSGPDKRIGWKDTWLVSDQHGVVGFTDGPVS